MTRLYYVQTNGNDFILADKGESRYIYTGEMATIPNDTEDYEKAAQDILNDIWEIGGWDEHSETTEELISTNTVLATIEADI